MKPRYFFLLLLFFSAVQLNAKTITLSLLDAIKLKKVRLSKTGVDGLGSENIQIELLSLSNDSLQIYFEPGLIFEPANAEFQTLLLADSVGVTAFPREYVTASLRGYCTESSDMGPRNVAAYQTIRWAGEDLKELAWLIHRAVAYDQQALIWAYQNRLAAVDVHLSPGKEAFAEQFTKFFARHRPEAAILIKVQPESEKPLPRNVVSIAANFPFIVDETKVLTLTILADDGQVVRRYFQNKSYDAGAHIIRFGFSDFFPEGTSFKAQLTDERGEVFKEMVVNETIPFEEMEVHQIRYRYTFLIKKNLQNVTLTAYQPNGERLSTLKTFPTLAMAHHQLQLVFTHYFDPKSKFILELADEEGKVYDKTEFDALGNSRKLYQEWQP